VEGDADPDEEGDAGADEEGDAGADEDAGEDELDELDAADVLGADGG
jgi:hypothetical protein